MSEAAEPSHPRLDAPPGPAGARAALRRSFGHLLKAIGWEQISGPFFRKYVALFLAAVCAVLVTSALLEIGFFYRALKNALVDVQREQAVVAAGKIEHFINSIENKVGWTLQLPWSPTSLETRRFDGTRLLRHEPAISELVQVDPSGHERLRLSPVAIDIVDSGADFSNDERFVHAVAQRRYYGPVNFRYNSEPYMTLAMTGDRADTGVTIADVNLKLIWDVVSAITVGQHGYAYVVDSRGRLIAHPDLSLVLRNTDLSQLLQVKAARSGAAPGSREGSEAEDLFGKPVLSAYAPIPSVGWFVFVELPRSEAYAPLYRSLERSGALLLAGLIIAFVFGLVLARRMILPIQALRASAARIGSGDLTHRIFIKSGDELEALGDQFNSMAARLQDSYATLEGKVEERTHQLEVANIAKSRFIAAASHDLRQPLHALGLFVEQLRMRVSPAERTRLVGRIGAAVAEMNELFNALLDVSRLDAGILTADIREFPISDLMARIERTFAHPAQAKGLSLRVVPSSAWIRSDIVLLERILLNLVSNAVRYTSAGGVLVGCRRRGETLRIEVWDTGIGIPEDQQPYIFDEFHQVPAADRDQHGGLGLGLAIVDRFRRLLDHPFRVRSRTGKGSCFSIDVPICRPGTTPAAAPAAAEAIPVEMAEGRLVLVIDDDPMVLEGMGGLLRGWGYRVVAVGNCDAAVTGLGKGGQKPDLIISDFHLSDGKTGIDAIEQIRKMFSAPIPALLVSGDTAPARLQQTRARGYTLLHKPVSPMKLRAHLAKLAGTRDERKIDMAELA